jgi:hypothetical protein
MIYRLFASLWSRNAGAAMAGVASIFGAMMVASATDVPVVATPNQSAIVPVKPEAATAAAAQPGQTGSLVINIVGFEPPSKGTTVQAVVTVKGATGEVHEIGRFGLFPNSRFKAKDGDDIQKFPLRLNPAAALLLKQEGKVSVDLVPYGGSGDGARLEIGKIDIQQK